MEPCQASTAVGNLRWEHVTIIGAVACVGFTLLSYWFSGIMNRRNWSWQVKPKSKKPGEARIQAGSEKPSE
jgi:hypothetical protein